MQQEASGRQVLKGHIVRTAILRTTPTAWEIVCMFSLQKRICNLTLSALRNSGRMKLVRNLTVFFFFVLPLLNSLLLFYWRITSIWQLIYFCINNWMCLLTAGELWMYGCWFYRPGETFHLATRKFLEKEVFKSWLLQPCAFQQDLGEMCCVICKGE